MNEFLKILLNIRSLRAACRDLSLEQLEEGLQKLSEVVAERQQDESAERQAREEHQKKIAEYAEMLKAAGTGLTHQCLYFEQPHTFEQILFIQTAEPALVGHA